MRPERFRNPSRVIFLVAAAVVLVAISQIGSAGRQALAQQQEGRARQVEQQKPTPRPSPTPTLPVPDPRYLPDDPPPPAIANPLGAQIGDNDVVTVDTSLVNLHVRVIDRNNRPIENVRPEEFRVWENGVPQTIELVSREEVPITYGLAVDNSGSLRSQLIQVIEAGKIIINSNKPGDETFLLRFVSNDKIETMKEFTADKDELLDGIDGMYIEGGQTAVIDAVYLASEHVGQYRKGNVSDRRRRALIVVTDGEDRVSYYNLDQLSLRLKEEDVQIYVIGFVNELDKESGFIRKSPRQKAIDLINRLASETGGRAFFPTSVSELPGIANEITRDMRTQYVVSYYPTNRAHDGTYRALKVQVADTPGTEKRIAIARPGYVAQKTGQPEPKSPAPAAAAPKPSPTPRRTP